MPPIATELYTTIPTWAVVAVFGAILTCCGYFAKQVVDTSRDLAAHSAADAMMFKGIVSRLDEISTTQRELRDEHRELRREQAEQSGKLDQLIGQTSGFWTRGHKP